MGTQAKINRRAAIYCRISADPNQRGLGVQRQEQDCRDLARRLGWDVVGVYKDNDISASAKSRKPRPGYQQMLGAIERGEVDAVLVYSTSRLTRRPREFEDWIDLVESGRVVLRSVASGDVDLSTENGKFLARVLASADAQEAGLISERVRRASRQRAEQGHWHGGRTPYGYRYDPASKTLHIVEEEAAFLRQAVKRFLAGESIYAITQWLRSNARRYYVDGDTGREVKWGTRTLRRTMSNPTIAALVPVDGRFVEGDWKPIVEREDWERAQEVFTNGPRYRARERPHVTSRKYALSGLLRCQRLRCRCEPKCSSDSECQNLVICRCTLSASPGRLGLPKDASAEAKLARRTEEMGWACMPHGGDGCGHVRIKNRDLEAFVLDQALARFDSPEMAEAVRQIDSTDEREHALLKGVQGLRERLDRLEDKYADDEIGRPTYVRKRAELLSKIQQSEAALMDLSGRAVRTHVPTGSEAVRRWQEAIAAGDATYLRSVLHAMIDSIDVRPHPKGVATRPSADPLAREALLAQRIDIHWTF